MRRSGLRVSWRACAAFLAGGLIAVELTGCGGPTVGDPDGSVPGVVSGASQITAGTPTAAPSASPPARPTPSPTPKPARMRFVFPVDGSASYAHNEHHDYPAADIIAACGLPVRAVTDGVVLEVNRVDRWERATDKGPDRGGLSVSILGDDGVRYYGSHFASITKGLRSGDAVTAGQVIGRVGATGDAGACHLHFGISPVCKGKSDWWIRRGEIWPASYLDAWRRGSSKSAATEIAAWLKKHGCPPLSASGAS